GAQLIAVERAVAAAAHPARALSCPVIAPESLARSIRAGLVAGEAGASRPEIGRAAEAPEAEAFVGDAHRTVGIAFTGRGRVAHPGDQQVAHLDVAHQPLRRAVRQRDVDADRGRPGLAQPDLHLLVAGAAHLPRRAAAVVEGPGAAFVRRHRAAEHDAHAVI